MSGPQQYVEASLDLSDRALHVGALECFGKVDERQGYQEKQAEWTID